MERRRFGPTGRKVAVIGQGTWYIDTGDRASAVAALRRGLDLGMNHIDTAEMYGDARGRGRRGDRRATRGGLPRLQGPPPECLPDRDDRGLRAFARPPEDGPPRLLPVALAGRVPAGGDVRRLRATPARGEGPLLGREQLRRAGPRGSPGDRRRGAHRLQSGALPPGGARDRARRAPLVRGARGRRGRLQPAGSRAISRPPHEGRPGPAGDRRGTRRDPAPGCPAVPGAAALAVRDPEGLQPGARRRERGGGRPPADRGRTRADRRGVPAGPVPASCRCCRTNRNPGR